MASPGVLQRHFYKSRLAFKKIAVFTDYFNVYESRLMNGPALPRMEEDKPEIIFEPHGFQVIEEKVFDDVKKLNYPEIIQEVDGIMNIISSLQREKDLDYKFRPELLFEALQTSLIRLITLGITGFDSPVAGYSIPEAMATLQSIKDIVLNLDENTYKLTKRDKEKMVMQLTGAIRFTQLTTNFNYFDRLTFIVSHINPLYKAIATHRFNNKFFDTGRKPLNPAAYSLFDSTALNIDFFSPNDRFRVTSERVHLGKKLFYDPILSATRKRNCATCHKPELAFTDTLATALAVDEKTYLLRKTPPLWFSALQTRQFFDSRTTKLENQLSDVVHNQEEMKGSLAQSVKDLSNDSIYKKYFQLAYPDEKEKITPYNISNAISSYMRTLVSYQSRFDKYMHGDKKILTATEKNGFNLFMGKGKCGTCHFMPLFNGLVPPDFSETESEVLGVPKTTAKHPAILDDDPGKINYSKSIIHRFAFKTPTLRNIELTPPYMHNGVYKSLEEVLEFYNNGGGAGLGIAPENQTLPPDKLNLTKKEIADIIAFLKTLTDNNFRKL
jgi:cytochrome c peroxidase